MARLNVSGFGAREDANAHDPHKLSSPMVFFWTMVVFLIIVGFIAAILYRQIHTAFVSNPGLNGLIVGVLFIGILLAFNQVLRLRPEVRWVNSFRVVGSADKVGGEPRLLAPMRALIGQQRSMALSTSSLRSILDSIATRLDEARDTSRYLIGLLVFLGLLGTFWGLLNTIGSITNVIQALDPGTGDTNSILDALKNGLSAPLSGMSTAFSSSLFGLSSSLVLGFLDLQAGRAQNRFYTELENWLSTVTNLGGDAPLSESPFSGGSDHMRQLDEKIQALSQDGTMNHRTTTAMANLAEGIQGLVKNMRSEQQMLRDWIEAQQEESKALRSTVERLASQREREED
ncbi:MotA/TolQ/ExbB proton channel family protein [Pararhizobium mangrovi]|uniref:Flagellar motor protein MotA n=1 Tax=Pararhizobium mangrovi TaxID=2590452 RepID=A0A506TZT6_9HYPH|nr:MotA/TolQ/ExbB proton channel family protein [Pararhizobium mangrovi]TPW27593.1 flagellar motor protein MotA [Pararhizobium mangrovi]